jgi:hypothetical protein
MTVLASECRKDFHKERRKVVRFDLGLPRNMARSSAGLLPLNLGGWMLGFFNRPVCRWIEAATRVWRRYLSGFEIQQQGPLEKRLARMLHVYGLGGP